MPLKKIQDADVAGKRVLMRVDFNVPIQNGVMGDDMRIKAAVPTIELLRQKGAAHITLMTHWGRPEGVEESLRTAPLFKHLGELTDVANVKMLENVRFDTREDSNDEAYAKELASNQDIFVNDAFAVCHRAASSVVGVTKFLPPYAGLLVQKEVAEISEALQPEEPALAIIGGAKFETKIPLLTKLLEVYGQILLGGALANDMLKARGLVDIKNSVASDTPVPAEMVADARILVPTDYVWQEDKIIDIGLDTLQHWSTILAIQKFVLWNGPVGWYEKGGSAGTDGLASALINSQAHAVIGGGNTAEAISKIKFDEAKVFVSTGGGAMLELITKGTLPGLEPLRRQG
ncbi:MAG TPA: phosphoglycerate kinase [Candidatus Paceibacterota bacterium]|nr:phosphoglycerate kinase [Candidatus Paceibacterota bacterium]